MKFTESHVISIESYLQGYGYASCMHYAGVKAYELSQLPGGGMQDIFDGS